MEAKTLTVPEAGRRYYGLGKNASYDAAKRGEIPTIKIGRLLRVPIIALERQLEMVAAKAESSETMRRDTEHRAAATNQPRRRGRPPKGTHSADDVSVLAATGLSNDDAE
jgi:hypothetical protein